MSRRISAYVLLADPSYLAASLTAYYPHVDRIVVSFDRRHTSWTGTTLPVDQCLRIVSALDTEHKCVAMPGDFARHDFTPFENETFQRQVALDAASEDADWVLQLDSDEVMVDPTAFLGAIDRADRASAAGLDFPARWLYSRVAPGRYLEQAAPGWKRAASYPGPLAVKAGTRLRHARQADVALYRVDIARRNTDPWHPATTRVDQVIRPDQAVIHFSWVRHPDVIRRKFGWSAHADHTKPSADYRAWERRTRHPVLTVATSPFRRRLGGWYRLTTVPEPPGGEPPIIDESRPQ